MPQHVDVHLKALQGPPSACVAEQRRRLAEAEDAARGAGLGPSAEAPAPAGGGGCCPGANLFGAMRFSDPQVRAPHPAWHPPVSGVDKGLKVLNSLTGDERGTVLEPFVPGSGNRVLWYTCGPTVYDSCHMGHARAYLTFDILRRVMEDYFRYDVTYHINITDIDDKIILRARRNYLLDKFRHTHLRAGEEKADLVRKEVQEALAAKGAALERKGAELAQALPEGTPSVRVKEREEKRKEHELKTGQHRKVLDDVAGLLEAKAPAAELFAAARDALGERLDERSGASVTDHDIFNSHARKFEKEYFDDMEALGIRPPDVLTRVTEYVDQIVAFIDRIVQKDLAYVSNGSVYLSIDAFRKAGHDYRKLRPGGDTSKAEMEEGEGALAGDESEKRHANDFALWKASKRGEPAWRSPWGMGRPGWHIECSVIASDILGQNMDVHAGGSDLKFPHHDNELAQSEAYYGHHQWVNYFFHAGHLQIKGLKMSKSLKNFVTIRQALEKYTARELRMMFLMQPWYREMNFSDQTMDDAKAKDKMFREFFGAVKDVLRSNWLEKEVGWNGQADRELHIALMQTQERVHSALCDNFDTPGVIRALVDIVGRANTYMDAMKGKIAVCTLRKVAVYVTQILKVLGVAQGADEIGFGDAAAGGGDRESTLAPFLDALRDFRDDVRSSARSKAEPRVFLDLCDRVRDEQMPPLGVRFEDPTDGERSRWKLDAPELLMREIEEKRQAIREKQMQKLQGQLDKLQKELADAEKVLACTPGEMFKTGERAKEFSEWDERGVPTKKADGEPLPKSAAKKLEKDFLAAEKAREKLLAKCEGGDPAAHLKRLRDAVAEKAAELKGADSSAR